MYTHGEAKHTVDFVVFSYTLKPYICVIIKFYIFGMKVILLTLNFVMDYCKIINVCCHLNKKFKGQFLSYFAVI